MNTRIETYGKIVFNPDDVTKKHKNQSSWKRMAIVFIKGDICDYYAWFLKKRFNLELTRPLRGAHVSFINDSIRDIAGKDEKEKQALWEKVAKKWNGKTIKIVLDIRPHAIGRGKHSPSGHWWLIVPHDERGDLQSIRAELGMGKPHFGMHMTIGSVVDKKSDVKNDAGGTNAKKMNVAHSEYILKLIDKGFIKFEN